MINKLLLITLTVLTFNSFAFSAVLVSGDYGVQVKDIRGKVHHCTLNVQNFEAEEYILLNIQDCPPPITNVPLFSYDNGSVYVSDKIAVETRRGGYKFYEIHPISSTEFNMISFIEYGDGEVGKPRTMTAKLKQ